MPATLGLLELDGADAVIAELCAAHGIDPAMIGRLLEVEQAHAGMVRRRGLFESIDDILSASARSAG